MKVNGRVWSTSYRNFTLVSSCEETSPLHKDSRTGQAIENRENMPSCCGINSLCRSFPLQIYPISILLKECRVYTIYTTLKLKFKQNVVLVVNPLRGILIDTQYVLQFAAIYCKGEISLCAFILRTLSLCIYRDTRVVEWKAARLSTRSWFSDILQLSFTVSLWSFTLIGLQFAAKSGRQIKK